MLTVKDYQNIFVYQNAPQQTLWLFLNIYKNDIDRKFSILLYIWITIKFKYYCNIISRYL